MKIKSLIIKCFLVSFQKRSAKTTFGKATGVLVPGTEKKQVKKSMKNCKKSSTKRNTKKSNLYLKLTRRSFEFDGDINNPNTNKWLNKLLFCFVILVVPVSVTLINKLGDIMLSIINTYK